MTIIEALNNFLDDKYFDTMINNIYSKCKLVEDEHKDKFNQYFKYLNIIYDEKLNNNIVEDAEIGKNKNIIGIIL